MTQKAEHLAVGGVESWGFFRVHIDFYGVYKECYRVYIDSYGILYRVLWGFIELHMVL